MKTISEVRNNFWNDFPEFKQEYRKTYRQNDYRTDIRCCFVDYVDSLRSNGVITEKLAERATL